MFKKIDTQYREYEINHAIQSTLINERCSWLRKSFTSS